MPRKDQAANNACVKYMQMHLITNTLCGQFRYLTFKSCMSSLYSYHFSPPRHSGDHAVSYRIGTWFSPVVKFSSPSILRFRVPEATIPPPTTSSWFGTERRDKFTFKKGQNSLSRFISSRVVILFVPELQRVGFMYVDIS
jgi:hypothetical protein